MALTPRHWVLAAALVCGFIAVANLPPSPEPPSPRFRQDWRPTREAHLQQALRTARRQLSLALRRDSLIRRTQAANARAPLRPVFINQLRSSSAITQAIDSTLMSIWRDLEPTSPDIRVGVFASEYGPRLHLTPTATDGRTCIVQLPLDWEVRWIAKTSEAPRFDELAPWLRGGLGACAFYAAFGKPGPAVEQWLLSRRFDLASEMDWMLTPPPGRWFEPGDVPPAVVQLVQAVAFWELDARYSASLDAVACNDGRLERCRTALFAPDSTALDDYAALDAPGVIAYSWWDRRGRLYGGRHYLADVIRAFGRERFEAFWRSPLPVDSAFHAAMDVPIEAWTAQWQRERMGGLQVGSQIRASSAFMGLLVAGLFLAGGAYFSRRRQVA